MAQDTGQSAEALASVRSALDARARDLGDADGQLYAVVAGAHATATDAIRRLEEIRAEIESAAAGHDGGTPIAGRELARLLLDRQHEMVDIVTNAKDDAAAKVTALQALRDRYR